LSSRALYISTYLALLVKQRNLLAKVDRAYRLHYRLLGSLGVRCIGLDRMNASLPSAQVSLLNTERQFG